MSTDQDDDVKKATDRMIADIGEIKGLLSGVSNMMRQQHENTNRRIDDMQSANISMHAGTSKRLDEMTASIGRRMDSHESDIRDVGTKADEAMKLSTDTAARVHGSESRMERRAGISGGASGGVIAAGIELAKYLLLHH